MTLASQPQPAPIQTAGSVPVLPFVLSDPETGPIRPDLSEDAVRLAKRVRQRIDAR